MASSCFADVWHGSLGGCINALDSLFMLLSVDEQQKAASYSRQQMRDEFIAVRALLRLTLASYLNVDARVLRFDKGLYGKPVLVGYDLQFNLSHSAGYLVVAVSNVAGVGVDLELIKCRQNLDRVARRCFSVREYHFWCVLPESERVDMFYRFWVAKEAFTKAVGRGLAVGLDECELVVPGLDGFENLPAAYGAVKAWQLRELHLQEGFAAALVMPTGEFSFRQLMFCSE